ncbi:WD40 repeat domain-containing protein [Pedococcus bigeumensis]|uniref:WD40 repeat domain-containing protein n=1 Tax=Pedococcus bigeumensis TaxID=433644 RepID=A0A502D235_9MICO|nr:WD40 repeat domain-containing protein [Pedococcus bigeumensis]TPG18974.1 WD40 repeat domain-containing protein [Pedococcus bigeumensis]
MDTRNNLLATLGRAPSLVANARSAGRIVSLAVNPATGQVAAAAAVGAGLELYDGRTLRRVSLPERLPAGAILASPDGQRYAMSVANDQVEHGVEPPVLLLDPTGARSAVQLGGFPARHFVFDNIGFGPINCHNMQFSPNGRWLAVAMWPLDSNGSNVTVVWDLLSPRRPVAMLPLGTVRSPTVSSDGRTLYTVTDDDNDDSVVRVTDLPSGKTRRILHGKDLSVRQLENVLVLSPDGRTLALGAGVEAVLVDATTLKPRTYLSGQGRTSGLAFAPDGTRLAASGDRLTVWDITGTKPVEILAQDGPPDDPGFSADGNTLYTRTYAGLIQEWDLAGDRRFISSKPGDRLGWAETGSRISPDGTKIGYVALTPMFRVRDVATGKLGPVVAPAMAQGRYLDIAWHPDSTTLNITSGDPSVRTWDTTTGRQLAEHRLGPPASEGAAIAFFTLDGKYLLVGTTEGRLEVLDARTLVPARAPPGVHQEGGRAEPARDRAVRPQRRPPHGVPARGHRGLRRRNRPIMAEARISHRGCGPLPRREAVLVDTGATGVGLLDATTMRWISRPNATQAGLVGWTSQFSDDGALVASVNENRLSQWDGRTGTYLGTVTVDYEGAPAFSKDDTRLVFAGQTGSVLTWNLDHRAWVAAACRLAGRALTEQEWHNYLPDRPFVPVCGS